MSTAHSEEKFDVDTILRIYEHMRPVMPKMPVGVGARARRLRDVLDQFDALFLDGFGVLNIGPDAITGALELLNMAQERQLPVLVVTNSATQNETSIGNKYAAMGLPIIPSQVVSSRAALTHWLTHKRPKAWQCIGVVDSMAADIEVEGLIQHRLHYDDRGPWQECDAIAVMGATQWNKDWHDALAETAGKHCPVLIANPDVGAPHPDRYSREPGYLAWRLIEENHASVQWFGKPHQTHFELALQRLEETYHHPISNKKRIAMVGDSLHTDILGGAAAGLSTVLITSHGLFRDGGADAAIAASGIVPDLIVETV